MNDNNVPPPEGSSRRAPWNKGKLPGAKPPPPPSWAAPPLTAQPPTGKECQCLS